MNLDSFNPATGERVGHVSVTPADRVPELVATARAVQPEWEALGLSGRRDLIEPAAAEFEARADELGALLTAEMGKPLREAGGEVRSCGLGLSA